jgi:hypothetical protein
MNESNRRAPYIFIYLTLWSQHFHSTCFFFLVQDEDEAELSLFRIERKQQQQQDGDTDTLPWNYHAEGLSVMTVN